MAPTCRRLLDHLKPQQLLGLTATPERGDGVDVAKQFFDGRTASELRLWDALEADLLRDPDSRTGSSIPDLQGQPRVSWTARVETRTMMLVQQATCS
jgi:superfamily II DNA or RNA helicase